MSWNGSPNRRRQNPSPPIKKSPDETQLSSGSGGRFNSFPLERTYMAASLSSNLLPFHTLLENSAKCPKNSPAERLTRGRGAQRRGHDRIQRCFCCLDRRDTGRSSKDKFIVVDDETRASVAGRRIWYLKRGK